MRSYWRVIRMPLKQIQTLDVGNKDEGKDFCRGKAGLGCKPLVVTNTPDSPGRNIVDPQINIPFGSCPIWHVNVIYVSQPRIGTTSESFWDVNILLQDTITAQSLTHLTAHGGKSNTTQILRSLRSVRALGRNLEDLYTRQL